MSSIFLKFFGGMIPRRGEQHLDAQDRMTKTGIFSSSADASMHSAVMSDPHATDAQNCNLYSGELRPLTKPALSHRFCRPGDECFNAPLVDDPSWPPDQPPPPPDCVVVEIESQPAQASAQIGSPATFVVGVNADASVPVYYQWFENNELMPGEVAQVLDIIVTEQNRYSEFAVLVTNPCGNEVSVPTTINVT